MPGGPDTVEVPAGSKRYYLIEDVEDLGKGFTNEHRIGLLVPLAPWPSPLP
jgi:hypothetical protein